MVSARELFFRGCLWNWSKFRLGTRVCSARVQVCEVILVSNLAVESQGVRENWDFGTEGF